MATTAASDGTTVARSTASAEATTEIDPSAGDLAVVVDEVVDLVLAYQGAGQGGPHDAIREVIDRAITAHATAGSESIATTWTELVGFATKHSASLHTAAQDPRAPTFADDWCAFVETVRSLHSAPTQEPIAQIAPSSRS